MIDVVAIFLAVNLSAIALTHAYWAAGGFWPADSIGDLVRTTYGVPRASAMPGTGPTLLVTAGLIVAAAWPLFLADVVSIPVPRPFLALVGAGIAAVFGMRGVAGYLPRWRRHFSAEPFATLDRVLYSPLCLAVCAGFSYVTFWSGAV